MEIKDLEAQIEAEEKFKATDNKKIRAAISL